MHDFYVLEGLDGAGRSTLGEKISKLLDGKFVDTPMDEFESLKNAMLEKPFDVQFFFFMASNFDASHKIKNILKKSPVVCARYLYTPIIAYCTHTGTSLDSILPVIEPFSKELIIPERTILLEVSEDEWYSRIQKRDKIDANDKRLLVQREKRLRAMELYGVLVEKYGWLRFDTTGMGVDQSADIIYRNLKRF